eukprot:CAMPEP_0202704430 /NCGR_PEP_ID=MMETSP1385-20130828/17104_1 /ASSEMBLY_ACC=CAM_ASM_000861 /TAXON_ID=933848 /ORGANISM="Elphidium margaritaceum" /LENGTH=261 /DNA_ID=CAMNT_0049362451 /DNA_START=25 /DNA_END=810 /DNA_ORIENTATION=+
MAATSGQRLQSIFSTLLNRAKYHSFYSRNLFSLQKCHSHFSRDDDRSTKPPFHMRKQSKETMPFCHLSLIHANAFSTAPSSSSATPQKRPFLNRFFRIFAVGPKIHFILEKSGAIVDHSLLNLVSVSSALAVYAFTAVTALSYIGVDTSPFVGLFGIGGAALGFGMKDIANNYLCGIILALQSLFKRGDKVTVAKAYTGSVQKMTLRHLELEVVESDDIKQLVYIPLSDVFANPIVVHQKMPTNAPDAMVTEQEIEDRTTT